MKLPEPRTEPTQVLLVSHVYMKLWTGEVEKVTVVEPAVDVINLRQHIQMI